jgi:hypothetical protein
MKTDALDSPPRVSPTAVLEHLGEICASPAFTPSKRSQQFLRYVVNETLEGRGEQIKERNIAHEVFGKGADFEPGEYSLVRVKAGEVRKRLSDFYETAPENGTRIELPVGSYVPRIRIEPDKPEAVQLLKPATEDPATESPRSSEPRNLTAKINRRQFGWLAGGTLGILGLGTTFALLSRRSTPLEQLWRPVFATNLPLLIFIPVMREANGDLTEWVGIGPSAALRRAADFLTAHHYPYHLRFGAELTFSQLSEQPSLLLGGFDVDWTLRMTHDLRFAPQRDAESGARSIVDKETKQAWTEVKHPPNPYVDVDYGILCRLFDATTGQIVLLAVGTQTFGTEGAANLLFYPELFNDVVKQAPNNWENKNFQAVIRVSVIGVTPSNPQVVKTHFW